MVLFRTIENKELVFLWHPKKSVKDFAERSVKQERRMIVAPKIISYWLNIPSWPGFRLLSCSGVKQNLAFFRQP